MSGGSRGNPAAVWAGFPGKALEGGGADGSSPRSEQHGALLACKVHLHCAFQHLLHRRPEIVVQ